MNFKALKTPAVFLFALLALSTAACAEGLAPARVAGLQDCETCPPLAIIPPGSFTMGADGPHKNERPAHTVTFDKPFAIGVYEVTFGQWRACVEAGACGDEMPDDHDWGMATRPVINITWADAQTYVDWLSEKTGATYRLPTEAEWEYAARAGTQTAYWWGDDIGKGQANCRDCGAKISHQTEPADSFAPNPWGLFNVHGNVWEWVQDCWNPTHEGAPADGSARLEGDCRQRVIRSGSWYYFSKNLRSSWRFKNDGRVKSYGIGFRVVRELP